MFELKEVVPESRERTSGRSAESSRVTGEMVTLFCGSYSKLVGGFPDPTAVRTSLELVLKFADGQSLEKPEEPVASKPSEDLDEGFIVYGEAFTGKVRVGRYATLDEALTASQQKGLNGEPGEITSFKTVLDLATGTSQLREMPLIGRRMTPLGYESIGFMDLREFEYGTRNGARGPVRSYSPGARPAVHFREPINRASPGAVRGFLLQFHSLVGVWRLVGDAGWRGEFRGSTDAELDSWLPRKKYTDEQS